MKHAFELIPLTIEAEGKVIANNVAEFREMVRGALENINSSPSTDEEFGQAELDSKALKTAEERIAAAKDKALSDAADLYALLTELDETSEEIRACRLTLEKAVAQRKEEVKAELIAAAMDKLDCAPRLRQSIYGKSVAEAIKGKRTLDSMEKALEVIITVHNGCIAKNRASIASFEKAHGEDMTMDREELETKSPETVEAELRRRFEAKKATDERKRLEAEAAKAKAELEAAKAPANVTPIRGVLPPDNLPKPPKIGSLPTGPSPAAEWESWIVACKTTFGALKAAKESLKHEHNIRRAAILAEGVNAAWKAMQEAGEEVAS